MAIIKAVSSGGRSLYHSLRYVIRTDKTRPDLISGWNIDPQNAYAEMMDTKKQWQKTGGRTVKHFIQSFNPEDGITPEEACAIASELIERSPMFAGYEVLHATHIDRDHIHTHFICNTVNIEDGSKFRYSKHELEELKALSDEIVHAHGYMLEHEREETENVTAWDQDLYQVLLKGHEKRYGSWMYDAALCVQTAMKAADRETFIRELEGYGYQVRWGEKSITFITPDGHRIRDRRLESTFKLSSIRGRYTQAAPMQANLRSDLAQARQRLNESMGSSPEGNFELDLRRSPSWIPDGSLEGQRYETACAVCQQLRASGSIQEFKRNMQRGGYGVRYSETAANVTFITPAGVHVRSTTLEKHFDLPSIKAALMGLGSQHRERSTRYDGVLRPEMLMRFADGNWDDLVRQERPPGILVDGNSSALNSGSSVPLSDRCARIFMYRDTVSSMWDYELMAAAIVLGRGMCQPNEFDRYLVDSGYSIVFEDGTSILVTPRGRRILIIWEDWEIKPPTGMSLAWVGTIATIADEIIRELCKEPESKNKKSTAGLIALIVETAILLTALVVEIVAVAVGLGIEAIAQKRIDKYVLQNQTEALSVSEILESLEHSVPASVPQVETEVTPEDEIIGHERKTDEMADLLKAVDEASAATSRQDFVQSLQQQGYGVRWTAGSTLSFITPEGTHVRASRLEKLYHLPSIAAAYEEQHVPQKGLRPAAAEMVRTAAEQAADLAEFNWFVQQQGYEIEWKSDRSDAVITAPTSQRMRLSSLEKTFSLPPVKEKFIDGIQYRERESGSEIGEGDLERLRAALDAAAESVQDGRTDRKNSQPGYGHSGTAGRPQRTRQKAAGREQRNQRPQSPQYRSGRARPAKQYRSDDFER